MSGMYDDEWDYDSYSKDTLGQSLGGRRGMPLYLPPDPLGDLPITLAGKTHVLTGGPYYGKPKGAIGIKLAVEIDEDCHVDLPIKDFSVPAQHEMEVGVIQALLLILGAEGAPIYAGCMGGMGRTGLFFACLVKVEQELNRQWWAFWRKDPDPVAYVREHYSDHAVETQQQQEFVAAFNAKRVAKFIREYLTN